MKAISKYMLITLLLVNMHVGLSCCGSDDDSPGVQPLPPETGINPETQNIMKITVGNSTFTATLANNATATAFKEFLPMSVNMSEHAGNEKFYNLPKSIPSNHTNPGTIQSGDLMLYSSSTLVLFYKSFSTSYSYTHIGKVDNPSGLQNALGGGSVSVKFELE